MAAAISAVQTRPRPGEESRRYAQSWAPKCGSEIGVPDSWAYSNTALTSVLSAQTAEPAATVSSPGPNACAGRPGGPPAATGKATAVSSRTPTVTDAAISPSTVTRGNPQRTAAPGSNSRDGAAAPVRINPHQAATSAVDTVPASTAGTRARRAQVTTSP